MKTLHDYLEMYGILVEAGVHPDSLHEMSEKINGMLAAETVMREALDNVH